MNIDPNCFKAFLSAAESLNFTEASRLAGMTQSGVSQHIFKLERDLGVELFHRIGKKVILTEAGRELLSFIEQYQDSLSKLYEDIQATRLNLTGKVRYAMPSSCLLSPHFGMLLKEKIRNFPEIELEVNLCHSEEVINLVINDKIDFGFVTKKSINEALDFAEFCNEEYVLVSSKSQKIEIAHLAEKKWIHYPDSDFLFDAWASIHLKHQKKFQNKLQGKTNSIHVAMTMVAHGLGISIFPRHCIEASDLKSKLYIHDSNQKICQNMIYIVSLKSAFKPQRVQKVIDTFHKMKS
jgi:DNA-binding transcriptional LysR family regulator